MVPGIVKTTLTQKKEKGDITLLNIKDYCIAAVLRTVLCWQRHRGIDQWNSGGF